MQLDRVDRRNNLKPQREPYWQRLSQGVPLGSAGSLPTVLRQLDRTSLCRRRREIHISRSATSPTCSKKSASTLRRKRRRNGSGISTWAVRTDARHGEAGVRRPTSTSCGRRKATIARDDTHGRFRRLVDDDPIARIELSKLASRHVAEWKKRALAKGGSRGYYNRNVTALRAALNLAKGRLEVASDHAWAQELKPLEER